MKLWLKFTLSALSLLLLGILGYGIFVYYTVKSTANNMYEPLDPVKPVSIVTDVRGGKEINIHDKDPFTVMVMGVDERSTDTGRTDTIIVLSVNPAKKSVLMFNIPRDTRTEIVGHGTVDKINHAYAFGGVNMAVDTVEKFLDAPIDYYIKVNMQGFKQLVDLLGGVEVNNHFAFDYQGHHYSEGLIKLNGNEALGYTRMRYDDPRGDLGRNGRQRQVLEYLMHSTLQVSNVIHLQTILAEIENNVRTDITFEEMKSLLINYRSDLENIKTVELEGKGTKINGVYYYLIDQEERNKAHDLIQQHLAK
ncbi:MULTISPECIES: LCP family protein [Paenibacillus]|uniref:LytR family transcriptional attenuator n=1 Tax=Paenibacillus pabuli TaxID=1472 RepID=A0A855Y3D1_9BACL|nr:MULTISPECIES: LCP family protein [Paenibacillus]PWW45229.1 LytR family transcriptional attenuator [Paenibacillus pabuli]PXW11566.1 LytR family transcriptional attenuator [Paenibacillus taichungensis]